MDKWTNQLLPSRQVRILTPTTNTGQHNRTAIRFDGAFALLLAVLIVRVCSVYRVCVVCWCCVSQFGQLVLTTSYGIMDHEEAKRKHTGGKVLGYFF